LNGLSKTHKLENWKTKRGMAGEKVERAPRFTRNVCQEHDGVCRETEGCSRKGEDDFLMSFDVRALYPNVLILAAIKLLERWRKSIDLEKLLTKVYNKIA
jgi:hypothetical protein